MPKKTLSRLAAVILLSLSPDGKHSAGGVGRAPPGDQPFVPRPLTRIEPGTQIADRAPHGWSQLVVKSQPKITSGDVSKVPELTVKFVSMFFTAILLKVERQPASDPPRYQFARAAIGIGARIGDRDTIISSDTYRNLARTWV